jgi:predicted Zn-dependent protease with MMP-like domain
MRQLIAARDTLADSALRGAYDERRQAAMMGARRATAFPTAWNTPAYFGAGYSGTLQHATANPNGAGQFAGLLAIILAIALFGGAVTGGLGSSAPALVVFGGIALLLGLAAAFLTSGSPLARGAQAWMEGEPSRDTSGTTADVTRQKRSGSGEPPITDDAHDAFAALASSALASVPDEFQRWLRNVLVEIVDEPSEEMLRELEVREGCTLFGLYSGVPLTRQGGLDVPTEIISIFQGPIERHCGGDVECMREQVRRTVLHEVAHHFGMQHEEMPAWIR